ncbi:MAG: S-layer homology domain-containing protein, partial [Vicinamibacteria bacterium]|nr:S-layer homology domain-containing protein [Vicinamibacteria bacterium]
FPEVIAVAATDNADEHLTSSNQGPEVDVAAPGVNVLSAGFLDAGHTVPTVMSFSGTSFSAALVSGVAALILSKDPSLDPGAVRALIEGGAKDIGAAGRDYATGAGRVDAAASPALTAGGAVPGDVTAPRAPLAVTVTPVFGTQAGRAVKVQLPPDSDRTGVMVRRTLIRPARIFAEGAFVGSDVTGGTTVDLTDTLPAGAPPGSVFYYTAFARDAAGNASNPAWAYAVAGELSPGIELPPGPTSFADVAADHPFAEAISVLSRAGVVNGFADGSFHPNDPVTRAQFAKMVVLAVGVPLPPVGVTPTFGDVPVSDGFPFIHVEAAAAAGIVKGLGTTTSSGAPRFGPYLNVSRVQVALMLARAGGEKLDPPPAGILHPFYDVPALADAEVQNIWAMEIARGRSAVAFEPWASATRGQVAQMVFRLRSVLQARP